jgi:hypothetical protein
VLAAYPPEQREQLVNQYKQWYDNYEKYLTQVQGNQAYTQQALAYEQYQNEQKRAADAQKEANIITGGLPMSFLDTTPVGKAPLSALQVREADVARREAAVAAREAAVSKREEEVASIAASLAAMQPAGRDASAKRLRGAHPAGESFAQLRTETRTQSQAGASVRGTGSNLHIVAAANLPADSGDHEDAATVASATGTADDEDGGEKVKVEDAPSTAAEDAIGENADNDDLENILLQKAAKTRRVPATKVAASPKPASASPKPA